MDWTVNDSLYLRFLKWKLKCEIIFDCELAILPESKKCKKVIVWSVDFGMDQYMSWCLSPEDLSLEVIWSKYEGFCKPQTNEMRARFDLLTSFRQGNRSLDERYNAIQAQVSLAKYPPETTSILHRGIFWFLLKDEEFVSKTIKDSNIDLDKFPTSKVWQLAKEMESSKSTARHIKAVAGDPQVAQFYLIRHQRTDLTPSKSKQKQHSLKFKSKRRYSSEHKNQRPPFNKFDPAQAHKRTDRCSKCGDSKHVEAFKCPAMKFHCKTCNKYGHFTSLCYKKQVSFKSRNPKAHQLQVGSVYIQEDSLCSQSSDLTCSDKSFCLQIKIQHMQANVKIPIPHHLITNLAYKLKPHHKRNQYLRARLDTCVNVNIMPASVYKLVFQDPDCKKLAPSKLKIGTYITDTVQLVGSCMFYLVHPDSKHSMWPVIMAVSCCHV